MVGDDPESFADLDGHAGAGYPEPNNCMANQETCPQTGALNDGGPSSPNPAGYSEADYEKGLEQVAEERAQNTTQQRELSPEGLQFIAKHETVGGKPNLTVYDDINGNPTIGYGHLVKDGEDFSKGITKTKALDLLRKDASAAEGFVNGHLSRAAGVGYAEFDALVSVAYTSPRAALVLIKDINSGAHPLFGSDFVETLPRQWLSPPGLINRRSDEADLYLYSRY